MTKTQMVDAASVNSRFASELSAIRDQSLAAKIQSLAVVPSPCTRSWDYGDEGEAYDCWRVLIDPALNISIEFCLDGFGPKCPWGVMSLHSAIASMGMDAGWFSTLEDAVRSSPIWRGRNPPIISSPEKFQVVSGGCPPARNACIFTREMFTLTRMRTPPRKASTTTASPKRSRKAFRRSRRASSMDPTTARIPAALA